MPKFFGFRLGDFYDQSNKQSRQIGFLPHLMQQNAEEEDCVLFSLDSEIQTKT